MTLNDSFKLRSTVLVHIAFNSEGCNEEYHVHHVPCSSSNYFTINASVINQRKKQPYCKSFSFHLFVI